MPASPETGRSRHESILDIAARMHRGLTTPLAEVERALARIAAADERLRAWVVVDAEAARQAAAQLTLEAERGQFRGPLHGVPIGIKDIFDVAGLPTRAGSPLMGDGPAERDALLVAVLRTAGAVVLGKTVTTEFASYDPPPTRNPWNLSVTPGGSSSGSAAAVAAGMCAAAVGSQTGGSITRPASFCGVAGLKPSYGLLSLEGVVPLAHHLDHPGPIARTVSDLALMLEAMSAAAGPAGRPREHYVAAAVHHRSQPPRLGLIETYFLETCDDAVRRGTLEAIEKLREAGAEVSTVAVPETFASVIEHHACIMEVEAAEYHRRWFPHQRDKYGANLSKLLDAGLERGGVEYATALAHQRRFALDMQACFGDVDALVTPATVTTAPAPETTGDPRFNAVWSHAGLPTVSVPTGLADDGLPLSLQFVGRAFDERKLLGVAAWSEAQLDWHAVPPGFD